MSERTLRWLLLGLLAGLPGWAGAGPPPPTPARVLALLRQARAALDPPQPVALALARQAETAARALANDTLLGLALDVQGRYHWQREDAATARPLLQRARQQLAAASPGTRAANLLHLADALTDLNQFRPARAAFGQAYALAGLAPADSAAQRAEIVNSLGVLFLGQDRPDSAAYYLFRALRRQQGLGRAAAQASTLVNLGAVFYQRQQWAVAAGYVRQALRLQATLRDSLGQAGSLRMLGAVVAALPAADSLRPALRYYRAAAGLLRQLHQPSELGDVEQARGLIYQRLLRPDSAEGCFRRARRGFLASGDSLHALLPALGLADLLLAQRRRLPEATALAAEALRLARQAGQGEDERLALRLLGGLAVARRDYRAAVGFNRAERALADSLTTRDNRRLTAELRTQYETEQAEQRVAVLEKDRELVRLRQQRTGAALLVLLLLALGAAAGAGAWYRRRQRRRETALRQRLAADLHDDVGSLLTQVALESALLRPPHPADPAQTARLARVMDTSQRAVRQLRDVVWSVDTRHDSFADLLDRLRDHAHEVLPAAGIELDFAADLAGLPAEPLALEARHALYLIYKEALHNVVKHARASEVTVRLARHGRHLELCVADNGTGLAPGPPPRTGGHGLGNMRQRATALGGEVQYEDAAPGLRVRVRLPVKG